MASLKYFLIRTVLFVVPFAVFMALGIGPLLSALYAVLIAFAVSYLFLRTQREDAAEEVRDVFGGRKQVRTSREAEDAEAEDALTDDEPQEGPAETPGTQGSGKTPGTQGSGKTPGTQGPADKPRDRPEGKGEPGDLA